MARGPHLDKQPGKPRRDKQIEAAVELARLEAEKRWAARLGNVQAQSNIYANVVCEMSRENRVRLSQPTHEQRNNNIYYIEDGAGDMGGFVTDSLHSIAVATRAQALIEGVSPEAFYNEIRVLLVSSGYNIRPRIIRGVQSNFGFSVQLTVLDEHVNQVWPGPLPCESEREEELTDWNQWSRVWGAPQNYDQFGSFDLIIVPMTIYSNTYLRPILTRAAMQMRDGAVLFCKYATPTFRNEAQLMDVDMRPIYKLHEATHPPMWIKNPQRDHESVLLTFYRSLDPWRSNWRLD